MIPIKNAAELEKMRKACRISAGALAAGGAAVKPGATTADVDKAVYDYIVRHGAKPNFKGYGGFPASVCVSRNDTVIHGIPSKEEIIREGDIVSLDAGALIDGFNGDNAATFACGEVSEEAKRLMRVTEEALYAGIEAALDGAQVGDIGHAVQTLVEAAGFSVVRAFVGHGVGRALHEDPEVPNFGRPGHGARLRPGMTLAIEPMVNAGHCDVHVLPDGWTVKTKDGSLSAHFEHTVAITSAGPEILTRL